MQVIMLFLAVILMTILAIKGVPIFYSAIISSIFVLISANMDVFTGLTETYIDAFALNVKNNFFLYTLGAIFGKILELSGAANAIAETIVNKIGTKAVIPAIIIAGGIMGYGGISVFVGVFALYPLMFSLFKKANISHTLAPGIYCAAAGSFSVWMPGSPSIQLLIPVQALGTNTFAAPIPGFIVGSIQIVLEILFCSWFVKKMQQKGIGWDNSIRLENNHTQSKKYPPFLLALLPMIVLISALGFFKVHPISGLTGGILFALLCYIKYLPWHDNMWEHLQVGFMGGCNALITTCAVVGFGGVVQATEAFQQIVTFTTSLNTHPLILSVIITAIFSGISGSGPGGEVMALPIIQKYFVPMGVNTMALTSALALSTMIFTLPSNSVVNTAIVAAKTDHKSSYFLIFMTVCAMSLISMILLLSLHAVMGYL